MKEPILDPDYWKRRLSSVSEMNLHHSIFKCPHKEWNRIEEKHKRILKRYINPKDLVIDAGCGYGRLLNLMPDKWIKYQNSINNTGYLGIDLSQDFVQLAREKHPNFEFCTEDVTKKEFHLLDFCEDGPIYDWAICVSIRPMMIRNLGQEVWDQVEENLHKLANKILYLEYDVEDNGSIE